MIKNALRKKSGNPENLKKKSEQVESSLANLHIVGEDLLRAF